jgi:hypothetical protein
MRFLQKPTLGTVHVKFWQDSMIGMAIFFITSLSLAFWIHFWLICLNISVNQKPILYLYGLLFLDSGPISPALALRPIKVLDTLLGIN